MLIPNMFSGIVPKHRVRGLDKDALAGGEDLNGTVGEPGPELVSQVSMRDRVVMLLDLDVVIEAGPAFLPFCIDIGFARQGTEGRTLQLVEQLLPLPANFCRCRTARR